MAFVAGAAPGRNGDAAAPAVATDLTSNNLFTSSVNSVFSQLIKEADGAVQNCIDVNTVNGVLTLSSSASLNMQKLMGDQSVASQTATSMLKSLKDSISGAVRNIS